MVNIPAVAGRDISGGLALDMGGAGYVENIPPYENRRTLINLHFLEKRRLSFAFSHYFD